MGQLVICRACQAQFRLSPSLLGGNGQSAAADVRAVAVGAAAAEPVLPPIGQPAAAVQAPPAPPKVASVAARPLAAAPSAMVPAPPKTDEQATSSCTTKKDGLGSPSYRTKKDEQASPSYGGKVARFIAAASQDSSVQLTAEGKLPELALADGAAKPKPKESPSNPLLLAAVLATSTLVSLLLLFGFDPQQGAGDKARQARAEIKKFYEASAAPLAPYQQLLREAELAAARGDRKAEAENYRRVLHLLHVERPERFRYLTGSKSGDEELEQLLGTLIPPSSQ
jgi:hypothetical protein